MFVFKTFIWIINAGVLLSYALISDTHLTGSVRASGLCATGDVQVQLSSGSVLLYQEQIPVGGSFEFYAHPGNYNLVATATNGCKARQQFSLTRTRTQVITVMLKDSSVAGRSSQRPGVAALASK